MTPSRDAVRTGLGTHHRAADHGDSFKTSGDEPDKLERLGVDDIDGGIRTIGEKVSLGLLVDPADVEAVQFVWVCEARRGPDWDRNDLNQSDGPVISCFVP